jgi:hypothetical protein
MRRRRVEKCLFRAESALATGTIEDAEAALAEARGLDPDSSEIAVVEARLIARTAPTVDAAARGAASQRARTVVVAAGIVGLAGAAGLAVLYWRAQPIREAIPEPRSAGREAAAGAVVQSSEPAQFRRLEIVHDVVRVPQATPRIVDDSPERLPAGSPVASLQSEPARPVLNEPRSDAPPALVVPARTEVRLDPLPAPPAPTPPVPAPPLEVAASSTPGRIEPPARAEASPSRPDAGVASEVAVARDESATVRDVLMRYELAYSRLDAAAAAAVWPRVNQNALARAFGALASQHVSLGSCDVAVKGQAARATCSGSASWEPKIGGRRRTEVRRWDFELRKIGGGWQIERALARGSAP